MPGQGLPRDWIDAPEVDTFGTTLLPYHVLQSMPKFAAVQRGAWPSRLGPSRSEDLTDYVGVSQAGAVERDSTSRIYSLTAPILYSSEGQPIRLKANAKRCHSTLPSVSAMRPHVDGTARPATSAVVGDRYCQELNRTQRKRQPLKVGGEGAWGGEPPWTKSCDSIGRYDPSAFRNALRGQHNCGHRTPGQGWKDMQKMPRKPYARHPAIVGELDSPMWCSEALMAVRGAQPQWDQQGPMASMYMQEFGTTKPNATLRSAHRKPTPVPRCSTAMSHSVGWRPGAKPSTPAHEVNVITSSTKIW